MIGSLYAPIVKRKIGTTSYFVFDFCKTNKVFVFFFFLCRHVVKKVIARD